MSPAPPRRPSPSWRVYVLCCRDGSLYTGITNDLERRIARHDSGKGARYTRSRRPVVLLYTEAAVDKGAALRREAEIKSLRRTEKLAIVGRARRAPRGRDR